MAPTNRCHTLSRSDVATNWAASHLVIAHSVGSQLVNKLHRDSVVRSVSLQAHEQLATGSHPSYRAWDLINRTEANEGLQKIRAQLDGPRAVRPSGRPAWRRRLVTRGTRGPSSTHTDTRSNPPRSVSARGNSIRAMAVLLPSVYTISHHRSRTHHLPFPYQLHRHYLQVPKSYCAARSALVPLAHYTYSPRPNQKAQMKRDVQHGSAAAGSTCRVWRASLDLQGEDRHAAA